jgi:hypothetical protein
MNSLCGAYAWDVNRSKLGASCAAVHDRYRVAGGIRLHRPGRGINLFG